jgi:hypothetical protein
MPTRKITVELPEELANSFLRVVPPSKRSQYISEALEAKLRGREEMLRKACLGANEDPETQQIQSEFDALPDMNSEAVQRKIYTEEQLIAACEAANADPEIAVLEREMDALSGDGLDEHRWHASASR